MSLTAEHLALVNAAKVTDGMFSGNWEYRRVLRMSGYSTKWYQCTDSYDHSFQDGESTIVKGSSIPFATLRMGLDRIYTFPRKLRVLKENAILLLDPTLVNVARNVENVAVKVHDIRPLTEHGDKIATLVLFKYIIPNLKRKKIVIVTTEYMKRELSILGIDVSRIKVVPEPVKLDYQPTHIDASAERIAEKNVITVGYIASNRRYKNIEFFVKLANALSMQSELKFKFILVSPISGNVRRSLGVDSTNNIEIIPWLDDIGEAYKMMDILAFPSLYEGFGRPIVEAMHYGIPVICNDIEPFKEIVADSGLRMPTNNLEKWTDAIKQLADVDYYLKYAKLSFIRAKNYYSPDNFRHKLLDAVESLLS